MKVAVIGSGMVGGTLGIQWANRGHEIRWGTRAPESAKVQALVSKGGSCTDACTTAEAAVWADVVVVATPWSATEDVIRSMGDLSGKILVDCTNPLRSDLSGLDTKGERSGAELVARWAVGARVVKIFNTTGFDNMANPAYPEGPATMFLCGDDRAAKEVASSLARDLGFDVVDAGGLGEAYLLEHLALLWIRLALVQKQGRGFAFRVMRR